MSIPENIFTPFNFFDLNTLKDQYCADLFSNFTQVWEVLPELNGFLHANLKSSVSTIRAENEVLTSTSVIYKGEILKNGFILNPGNPAKNEFTVNYKNEKLEGATVIYAGAALLSDDIQLGKGVIIEPGALIKGPAIIGDYSEIRQGAYLRGSTLVGQSCVVGHATEMKNSIMLDEAKAGHFAYVGDSILGRDVNLGAGTKLANLKITSGPVKVKVQDETIEISIRKIGAILGDFCSTGCNSVTSPGTFMGRKSLVVPNMTVKAGYYPARSVIRQK